MKKKIIFGDLARISLSLDLNLLDDDDFFFNN
jgi:hypothetical protein